MIYDPNRDPYNPNRPAYVNENGSGGTALFIGALVLLALVFGGVYFYANERDPQVASDMTINNTPVTRPTTPPENPSATPSPTPSAPRSAPAPSSQP